MHDSVRIKMSYDQFAGGGGVTMKLKPKNMTVLSSLLTRLRNKSETKAGGHNEYFTFVEPRLNRPARSQYTMHYSIPFSSLLQAETVWTQVDNQTSVQAGAAVTRLWTGTIRSVQYYGRVTKRANLCADTRKFNANGTSQHCSIRNQQPCIGTL